MIDFSLKEQRPVRVLIGEVLDFVDDVVDELGSRGQMQYLRAWTSHGDTGADRQIAAHEATRDLRAVVDFLIEETRRGL
jgi:carboxylate-amine ligase